MESVQIAMTRLSGPGISTVCRAKLLVDSTVLGPKMNLPDTHPQLARLSIAADTDFFISLRIVYRIYLVIRQHADLNSS